MNIIEIINGEVDKFLNEEKTKSEYMLFTFLMKNGLKNQDDFVFKNSILKIFVKEKYIQNYYKLINNIENYYGWFLAGNEDPYTDEMVKDVEVIKKYYKNAKPEPDIDDPEYEHSVLIFEKKYGDPLDVNKIIPDFVYHVTDEKYLHKIKKNGLVPRSKSKKTYHPERIYLLLNKGNNVKALANNPEFDIDNPVLLKIDVSEFKKYNKFYEDPNLDGGVFVVNNIPPNIIKSYVNIDTY